MYEIDHLRSENSLTYTLNQIFQTKYILYIFFYEKNKKLENKIYLPCFIF